MADTVSIAFKAFGRVEGDDCVVFVGDDLALSPAAREHLGNAVETLIARAAAPERFKGKSRQVMTLLAPGGLDVDRLVVVGIGPASERAKLDWRTIGGIVAGKVAGHKATVLLDAPGEPLPADTVVDFALGARMRGYRFDQYKTKKKKDDDKDDGGETTAITIALADPAKARRSAKAAEGVASGIILARDFVNEPPNVLNPAEFARRAQALEKLGVEVEVLDEKALRKLGFRALLAVGQGSSNESRVVVMRWNGGKSGAKPLAFVGKGVCFDSGGISIKPGAGMEDMKGDMAGAACVVGLMHTLAARKAKANVVGIVGLVENMPDGNAQRPGDIVTTLSGQTVEIINTDAEGRLVLADLVWYVEEKYKPQMIVDLATLTGAILIALGQEHAGLFSNDDTLSERLHAAGQATGEKVWRLPLGPEYDKLIDSKFADMKNTGGRHGGSITAAQFIQRFVKDTPWAHLDIAGTGMSAPQTETNRSWGSGWGVRLLDRLVRDHYES